MSDLNSYSFAGRLAAPPEVKYTQGGTAIWTARVAVGYGYGEHKGTSWLTVKALGKRAEAFGKWSLSKGQQVWGCGELQVREYEKNDGGKGISVDVLVEQFGGVSSESSQGDSTQRPARQAPPQNSPAQELDYDSIPF